MNASTTARFRARFRSVLEYVDNHIDEPLDIAQLGAVAAFSKFHFHRQFAALFGVGVYKYVQLQRLKRASYRLAFRAQTSITDIALASGYEHAEAFTRAFKKNLGQSPSEFRASPNWFPWFDTYQPLYELRNTFMPSSYDPSQVEIVNTETVRVATLEHHGHPRLLGDSIRNFIEWRKENKLSPKVSATYNVLHNDPAHVASDEFRFDLCAATDKPIAPNNYGVVSKTIPGGRCARLCFRGSDDSLGAAVSYLYSTWLPQSGEEPRDFPLYLQRVKFFPDVPEHEAEVHIFLPLR